MKLIKAYAVLPILLAAATGSLFGQDSGNPNTEVSPTELEKKDRSLENAIKNLVNAPEDERAALKAKIKRLLEKQCDRQFESHNNRIKQIETQLTKLKQELEIQKKARNKLIFGRLKDILGYAADPKRNESDLELLSNPLFSTNAWIELTEDNLRLIKVNLPGMDCGGCAAVVRKELTNLDGVQDIKTDVATQNCSFKTPRNLDIEAKLNELAENIVQFKDWKKGSGK